MRAFDAKGISYTIGKIDGTAARKENIGL